MALALLMPIVLLAKEGRAQSAVDGFDPGADRNVKALAVQPDGKIVVGGTFSTLGGGGMGTTTRKHIGRLPPDGSVDSFNPGANDVVDALAIQADGKIVVGGFFTTFGGGGSGTIPRSCIARLNPDGTIDAGFDPGASGRGTHSEDSTIFSIVVQADGKIVVGGELTLLGGGGTGHFPRSQIGRLNPDGTIDMSYDPGANNDVKGLAVQRDGKTLVVGDSLKLGGGGTGVF